MPARVIENRRQLRFQVGFVKMSDNSSTPDQERASRRGSSKRNSKGHSRREAYATGSSSTISDSVPERPIQNSPTLNEKQLTSDSTKSAPERPQHSSPTEVSFTF